MTPNIRAGHKVAVVLGAGLEIYDFLTFSYFSPQIGAAFFPGRDPISSLLAALGVFAVGFVARPVGGVVFGLLGDRVGRKSALQWSFILMGIGLGLLVLTPPYAVIGMAAPILVVFGRILQGLALGGEVGPAAAFMLESSSPNGRGLALSWLGASQGAGSLVAGAGGAIAATLLSPAEMAVFGWRIVLGIGLLVLPLGYALRRYLPETLHRPQAAEHGIAEARDASEPAYRPAWQVFGIGFLTVASGTITTYLLLFLPTYATVFLKASQAVPLAALAVGSLIAIFAGLITGAVSDHIGRTPLVRIGKLLFTVTAIPATLFMIAHPDSRGMFTSAIILSLLGSVASGTNVWIAESLPMARRSIGTGVVVALAVTILGGSTQPLLTWAMAVTHNPLIFGYVLAAASLVGLIASLLMHETAPAVLARRAAARE